MDGSKNANVMPSFPSFNNCSGSLNLKEIPTKLEIGAKVKNILN